MVGTERVRGLLGAGRRPGWLGVPIALLAGVTVAAAGLLTVATTAPTAASTFGPDAVGLIATEADDPETGADERPIYVYRYAPGATFLTMTSVRNDGPIALTLLGPEPPPADIESTSLAWADRLLQVPWPDVVGPEGALPVDSVVIDAGQEVGVWIVWRIGGLCPPGEPPPLMPGSGYGFDSLDLRWSVLGIPRSGTLGLRYSVEIRHPLDDQLVTCPG